MNSQYTQYILFFFLILTTNSHAQMMVNRLSNTDGLSNNSINCIFEDSKHELWIGTWDGLNIYNGRDFKSFRYNKKNKNSISNNVIRQIVEDNQGRIWIATDFGINVWNRDTGQFTRYFYGTGYIIPKQEKSFLLAENSNENIICYVREEGFFYSDRNLNFKSFVINGVKGDVKKIAMDDESNLYILNTEGVLYRVKLSIENNTITLKNLTITEQNIPVSDIFYSGGKLILNYGKYLKLLDKNNSYPSTIDINQQKNISQILFHNGHLYIGFYEGGYYEYDLKEQVFVKITDIPDKISIFSAYISSQNILWIGTDGQGIIEVYKHTSPFKTIKTDYPVRSFCEDRTNRNILIGTKGDGIKLMSKETGTLTNFLNESNGLSSNSVYAIEKNEQKDIFIGTDGQGINILYADNNYVSKLSLPPNSPTFRAVYSICFTNNDSVLWLGTSGYGLIKIDLKKDNHIYKVDHIEQYMSSSNPISLNNNIIYSLIPDPDSDYLWVGTRGGGVNRFNIQTKIFERIEEISKDIVVSNNDILSLLIDQKKSLWIGTSYGLNKISLANRLSNVLEYTDNEGIANNTIHGILEGNGNSIWISTNGGITHLDPERNIIENYTVKDGLQNNEFADGAYFKDSNNTLYFGGASGLSYFNPDDIHLRDFEPSLTLSSLKIYNIQQNINERIKNNKLKLANSESQVTFTFIAHDFINNENCEYVYRLLNLSDKWIHNGNNPNIVFTQLPPGKYSLEVKCTNGDRVWGNNVYTVGIDVAFPWWLSQWAFIIYFIITVVIIYITQSVIRNRIRLNRQILLEHIEKQHQQKIHESRLNFFTNVAHEFFTPLTLIYGPAQYLLEKSGLDNATKHYIQIIKNNADRMQKLINELMEFRKLESGHTPLTPEVVDVKMMIDYISDNYTEITHENRINFKIELENISTIITDRNSLEKILFNLISNAFKYTPAGGSIFIRIRQENDTLYFLIKNTGKGLTAKQMSQVFSKFKIFDDSQLQNSTSTGIGLSLTKSLVELLGGDIQISSILGEHVSFSVEIPSMKDKGKANPFFVEESETTPLVDNFIENNKEKETLILIVEDERNIRELLRDILKPYYKVEVAKDGEEALHCIDLNIPDIIISDVLMPKLDGISLIKNIRDDQRTKHIPIISISAKTSVEDHINAYEHGADLYITKPFHPQHVLTAIENLLGRKMIMKEYFNSNRSSMIIRDGIELHLEDERFLQEIISYIEKNIEDESLNPNSISDFIGISKATLYRKLKDLTGNTPSEYVRRIRLEHSAKLLVSTKLTVAETMFRSGFANKSYFYREFAKQYGMSPTDYRKSKTS
ncbi:response regulator [Dysgonomonas sp. Marseille-P4677]|uniref:hybrid sensor histidine kinase/response regulator transcription factor n=1 Tax=Dysgonomonas sp. Marseille-P4677 TaxID=2364790 RepID=UPI001914B9A4|nr:two-component regulator propeller domain-containing protein [Dysgonomonas sp. Marseille-P4677]MBK5722143.1 response regulator [Dysgonomonas sp. Marseille-P4677]